MPKSKHDRTTVAGRRAPGPGERGPRRRARGQVSGISIPGRYRWRLDEAIVDAFLAGGALPVSRPKLGF